MLKFIKDLWNELEETWLKEYVTQTKEDALKDATAEFVRGDLTYTEFCKEIELIELAYQGVKANATN